MSRAVRTLLCLAASEFAFQRIETEVNGGRATMTTAMARINSLKLAHQLALFFRCERLPGLDR